jgi:DNA-binding XRE family transcriptional regulator
MLICDCLARRASLILALKFLKVISLTREKHPASPLGGILKQLRVEAGMSIQALSDVSEVHPNTISAYERGRHLQLDSLEALAEALGYEIDILKI